MLSAICTKKMTPFHQGLVCCVQILLSVRFCQVCVCAVRSALRQGLALQHRTLGELKIAKSIKKFFISPVRTLHLKNTFFNCRRRYVKYGKMEQTWCTPLGMSIYLLPLFSLTWFFHFKGQNIICSTHFDHRSCTCDISCNYKWLQICVYVQW